MIRIRLDEPTVARTRIAISPLWETVCGLYLLAGHPDQVPWPYAGWAARARTVLSRLPATAALRVYLTLDPRLPDFLCPIPPTAAPSLDEELAALRATPREVIEEQIPRYHPDELPRWLQPFRDDPAGALDRLADGIAAYWAEAMAPVWPVMRAALDEEVLHRARALAAEGPDALLADLHERVRWERPTLTLVKSFEQSFDAVDQRLLLVPLIFSRGALVCSSDSPKVVAVSYQARGAALLADGAQPTGPADTDRLGVLLGRGRAAVLRALSRPASTAGLAATLGLAPSTVSEHLSGLLAAGVVNRRRIGRRVLYGLEPAGLALVDLLGVEPDGPHDAVRARLTSAPRSARAS